MIATKTAIIPKKIIQIQSGYAQKKSRSKLRDLYHSKYN